MSFHKYFSAERDAAEHALVVASDAITGGLASFSTWLMAGSGAAFSLFIINIDKLAPRLSGVAFQCALLFFAASLLAGLISRWMATSVASQLAVLELIKQRAADVDHTTLVAALLSGSSLRIPAGGLADLSGAHFLTRTRAPHHSWVGWWPRSLSSSPSLRWHRWCLSSPR